LGGGGWGPSIAFTTLINLVASLVAAQMPIRVVEYFCYQMAVAVAANLVALLLLFVPAVALDCRRTLAAAAAGGGGGCCRPRRGAVAAGGAPGGGGGGIALFAREWYAPRLLSPAGSAVVLVGFGALCGALAWHGFARTETGLAVSDFTSVGSYQRDFALRLERDYAMYPAYLFAETRAVSAPATQQVGGAKGRWGRYTPWATPPTRPTRSESRKHGCGTLTVSESELEITPNSGEWIGIPVRSTFVGDWDSRRRRMEGGETGGGRIRGMPRR
jgi:hypothetical protein